MVCHAFVSITFAFSCYSRSVEARNCRSDRRETGTQIGQIGKTENRIGYQIRKPVSIFRENRKPNAKQRKIRKPAMNNKTEKLKFFWHKNRKTDLKNSQNRKTENPSAPLDKQETHTIKDISRISVHAQKSALLRKSAHTLTTLSNKCHT